MPIKLEDYSPVYKAYKNLRRAPRNFLQFSLDENGWPKIRRRESICGMPEPDGQICGRQYDKESRLWDHLESYPHRIPKEHRTDTRKNNLSLVIANKLRRFYTRLMKNEEYEGKGARQNSIPPPFTASPDDDEDYDDSVVPQRGISNRQVTESRTTLPTSRSRNQANGAHLECLFEANASSSATAGKRARYIASDDDEEYLLARLKEKRLKRELKEAELEEAEMETKLAVRRKR